MQINLIPDASVSSAPAGFTTEIQLAADVFEQDIPGNYTVNITYGWGTYDNEADDTLTAQSGAFSFGGTAPSISESYATVKSWLSQTAVLSDQIEALASLPVSYTDLPGEADDFYVSSAQEKALGVFQGDSGAVDGSIGFNIADADFPAVDWEIAALTEIGHALGNLSSAGTNIMDLYRYSAPGDYQWTAGQPAYFSIDGGSTDLANYATSFDTTLFQNSGASANDPFAYPFSSSTSTTLTSLDLEVLNVLGFGGATATAAVPEDFYDNGRSDILWRNANGDTVLWNSNGAGGFASQDLGFVSTSWRIAGTGDFNGDGESDILWRNTDGDVCLWNSNGAGGFAGQDLGDVSTSWRIAGTGDFNGDGKADILWRNTDGDTDLWDSNSAGRFTAVDIGDVDTSWQIAGTGDFNGDGKSDILWRNANGDTALWSSDATGGFTDQDLGDINTSWQIAGVGDFNGDGESDILWRNANGDTALWNSNGAGGFTDQDLGVVDESWQIAATGDFNGDGRSDILWRNTNGDTCLWDSNTTGGFTAIDLGYVPTSWKIQA